MEFVKMVASGNDFILIEGDSLSPEFVVKLCDRKYGVGADGVLLVSFLGDNKVGMRIFNSDGSEAEMCGNGSRCVVMYACRKLEKDFVVLQTLAGQVKGWFSPLVNRAKVQLTRPSNLITGLSLDCSGKLVELNHINTGVPHSIVFVDEIEDMDILPLARQIRYHSYFQPAGTNVDFVKILDENNIRVRTYERGVEAETLSCGTGSVASAVLSLLHTGRKVDSLMNVYTQGGEVLTVEVKFDKDGQVSEVFLEGDVREVFEGRIKSLED